MIQIIQRYMIEKPILFLNFDLEHCNDGVQNYDEVGIDCGGSCKLCGKTNFMISVISFLVYSTI